MKKIVRVLVIVALLFGLSSKQVQAQEAFIIDDTSIEMNVYEDGRIDIIENYVLDFQSYRHGFYRDIPNIYNMDMEVDGKVEHKKYYFPVSNIKCSTTCEVDASSKAVRIKLGDADQQVIGQQRYQISYQVQTKDLRLGNGVQALYWNLITNFDTTVSSLSYKITMPKAFDASNVYTSTGSEGKYTELLTQEVQGNVIQGHLLQPLHNYEAASIRVDLDEQYFVFPEIQDYTMLCSMIAGIILLIFFFLFLKFGKDEDIIVTVEFKAPRGLNSAEVGYIIDGAVQNKDVISLLIDWANRGFLKIHDQENSFELEKIQEMSKENSKGYERTFFNAIFKDRDMVNEAQLKEARVGNALQNAKLGLRNSFHGKRRKLYHDSSIVLQVLCVISIVIVNVLFTYLAAKEIFGLFEICIPYLIPSFLFILACVPWIVFMRMRYTIKKKIVPLLIVMIAFLNAVLLCVQVITQMAVGMSGIAILICSGFSILMIIIMMFMDKRTKQANAWLGQILGLKEFIITCELEQLEMFVKENPSAFYAILPYAYVMGLTDVWVKKFEHIAIQSPDWYVGRPMSMFTTVLWWNHFHYGFSHLSTAASYTPPSSGTGGGSFGSGGFGGGGFAGGGFGGGGGGSW